MFSLHAHRENVVFRNAIRDIEPQASQTHVGGLGWTRGDVSPSRRHDSGIAAPVTKNIVGSLNGAGNDGAQNTTYQVEQGRVDEIETAEPSFGTLSAAKALLWAWRFVAVRKFYGTYDYNTYHHQNFAQLRPLASERVRRRCMAYIMGHGGLNVVGSMRRDVKFWTMGQRPQPKHPRYDAAEKEPLRLPGGRFSSIMGQDAARGVAKPWEGATDDSAFRLDSRSFHFRARSIVYLMKPSIWRCHFVSAKALVLFRPRPQISWPDPSGVPRRTDRVSQVVDKLTHPGVNKADCPLYTMEASDQDSPNITPTLWSQGPILVAAKTDKREQKTEPGGRIRRCLAVAWRVAPNGRYGLIMAGEKERNKSRRMLGLTKMWRWPLRPWRWHGSFPGLLRQADWGKGDFWSYPNELQTNPQLSTRNPHRLHSGGGWMDPGS
ncbi:hypothetical protein SODALDRAFT_376702 [Sodiomyces alkalinus F11]|uniref:Uncharacterized protein n=1 Tax=Sodiomyces alkalinus (strain CBS 110278 / VKM F-3762 / F11) TaxID=1314773 RepID=A0A3N2Q2Y0_SODAK|nr:hypothetical protein SODALDRAFT_376702 [Sodiomyces alkalinus F11]ROT40975.1 hypothetical protein SODALDRAFT_376702 [Sodiomyces alkalinus F11]